MPPDDRDSASKFIITFEINVEREPELAAFIRSIPYGRRSRAIRDVLDTAAKIYARNILETAAKGSASRKEVVAKKQSRTVDQQPSLPLPTLAKTPATAPTVAPAITSQQGHSEAESLSRAAADAMLRIGDQF